MIFIIQKLLFTTKYDLKKTFLCCYWLSVKVSVGIFNYLIVITSSTMSITTYDIIN